MWLLVDFAERLGKGGSKLTTRGGNKSIHSRFHWVNRKGRLDVCYWHPFEAQKKVAYIGRSKNKRPSWRLGMFSLS